MSSAADPNGGGTSSIVESVASAPKTLLRVKVINGGSGLSKDLLVEIHGDSNLFDSIYDNPAVKKAKVRKWDAEATQNVKGGSHEIRCSVWNSTTSRPLHAYRIEALKNTSTEQLHRLVTGGGPGGVSGSDSGVITLKLHCVDKSEELATAAASEGARSGFRHPPISDKSGGGESSSSGSSSSTMRCPFSGVAFDEAAIQEFLKHKNNNNNSGSGGGCPFSKMNQ